MPLYLCNSAQGTITADARQAIADDITRIHCDATGAPPQFVHAFFIEDAATPPLSDAHRVVVSGSIRGGRDDHQKQTIIDEIRASITSHTGVAIGQAAVITTDIPASWAMEGGHVMPEPGDEAAWLEAVGHEA